MFFSAVLRAILGLLLVFSIVGSNIALSQCETYTQLFHKSFAERAYPLRQYFISWDSKSLKEITTEVNQIKNCPQASEDNELIFQLELNLVYMNCVNSKTRDYGLKLLDSLRKPIYKTKDQKSIIIFLTTESYVNYFFIKNYQITFRNYYLLLPMLNAVKYRDFPYKLGMLREIGDAFYTFQYYDKAIEIFKECIKLPETNSVTAFELAKAYNSLGLCYQKLGNYELSNFYLQKIQTIKDEKNRGIWMPIAAGNIGVNYFSEGKYDLAISHLLIDIQHAEKTGDLARAAGAYIYLAKISFQRNDLNQTGSYLNKAQNYIRESGQKSRNAELFPILSKYYISVNQPQKADLYLDSALYYSRENHNNTSLLKIMKAEQTVQYSQDLLQQQEYKSSIQHIRLNRNRWLIFSLITLLSLLIMYLLLLKKSFTRRNLLYKSELKNSKQQFELDIAYNNLMNYTKILKEKNQIISRYETEEQQEKEHIEISHLKKYSILTDEQWKEFRDLFEKVYPNFIKNAECMFPNLSKMMIIYLTLSKMKMTTSEMSSTLGITPQAIRNTKSRLMKQIKLPDSNTLSEILDSL